MLDISLSSDFNSNLTVNNSSYVVWVSITYIAFQSTNSSVYYTSDSGINWYTSTLPTISGLIKLYSMGTQGCILAATSGILYLSNNFGSSFFENVGL